MKCPKCGYDIFHIYEKVINTGKNSKYCRITNVYPANSFEVIDGADWDIECICPKCTTKWMDFDGNY